MYRTTARGQYFDHQENFGEWFDYNARDPEGNSNVRLFAPRVLHTSLVRDLSTPTSILYSQIATPLSFIKILYNMFSFDVFEKMEAAGCPHPHTRFECFGNLFVSVPKQSAKIALTDCLTKSLEGQIVVGEKLDQWGQDTTPFRCAECNKVVQVTTKIKFGSLPQILVMALKRFLFGFGPDKILTPVTFEKVLNVRPYLSDTLKAAYPGDVNYHLYGIVIHHGGVGGGHYFAYAKDEEGHWYCYNDGGVSNADDSIAAILSQDQEVGSPYVLFYERVPAFVGTAMTGVPAPLVGLPTVPVDLAVGLPRYTYGTFVNETNDTGFLMASFTALAHASCFYDYAANKIEAPVGRSVKVAEVYGDICAGIRRGECAISLKNFKDHAITSRSYLLTMLQSALSSPQFGEQIVRMASSVVSLVSDMAQISSVLFATYDDGDLIVKIRQWQEQEEIMKSAEELAYIIDQIIVDDITHEYKFLADIRQRMLAIVSIYKQFTKYLKQRSKDELRRLWNFCRFLRIGDLGLGSFELNMITASQALNAVVLTQEKLPLAPFFLGEQNAGAFVEQLCTALWPPDLQLSSGVELITLPSANVNFTKALKMLTNRVVIINAQGSREELRKVQTRIPLKVGDYVVKSIVLHTGDDVKTGHYAALVDHKGTWMLISYQNAFVLEDQDKLLKNLEEDGTFFAEGSEVYNPVVICYENTSKLSQLQASLSLLQNKLQELSERLIKLKY